MDAKDAVPSFAAVAAMKSTTQLSLQAFLQTNHHNMPDWRLTRQQVDDVVAYILTLRPKSS
jgi:mono/diheme cytochrome c family protein